MKVRCSEKFWKTSRLFRVPILDMQIANFKKGEGKT